MFANVSLTEMETCIKMINKQFHHKKKIIIINEQFGLPAGKCTKLQLETIFRDGCNHSKQSAATNI